MRLAILCFTLGVCLLQVQPLLPGRDALLGFAAAASLLLLLAGGVRYMRCLLLPAAFLLGFCWAGGWALARMAETLAPELEGREVVVVGVINDLPQAIENGVRFGFRVEHAAQPVPQQLVLSWYQKRRSAHRETVGAADVADVALPVTGGWAGAVVPPLHVGQRWSLLVRLKRPHGNVNPHGFDYEAWLLAQGVRATGYIRSSPDNRLLAEFVAAPTTWLGRLRETVRTRFARRLADAPYAGILSALVIGDQRAITAAQWQQFSRTGITHLVSISGLHVTMLAGLAYTLMAAFWRRQPALALRLPTQRAAALAGFVAALLYSLLAGFAVPAQRTLYMLAVAAYALWCQRQTTVSRVLALALLVVLLVDPWAVLAAGFWLSFGAVGLLFYVASGRLGKAHWLLAWGRTQWAVTLGSLPLLLVLFQQFSLVSPLANAVAIPLVSFVITPLALLAALPWLDFLLVPAHWLTSGLMQYIGWLAQWPWAVWQQAVPPLWLWLAGLAGCLWWLLPRGFPARWLGSCALLPLLLWTPPRPVPGAARVTVLDVGQGLAVHVQTAHHDLIYDTGPLYTAEADAGNRVLLPYLRAMGVSSLDGVVVTHSDTDHSGGAESLLDGLPVGWLMSSLAFEHPLSAMPVRALPCQAGQEWVWDGVRFTVLHPAVEQYGASVRKTNDMSCVLRVRSMAGEEGTLLLTADIEARSEAAILQRLQGQGQVSQLRAQVLLAPHHGSRTSSSADFVAAVGAQTVIFPVGYRNPFGHPRPEVVARYQASGAVLHRTDFEGALVVELPAAAASPVTLQGERAAHWRYWYGQ